MGSQILAKTIHVLETLAREYGGCSVTELSRAVGMNVSTVHRILSSLMERGYVQQDDAKKYSITLRFLELSSSYLNRLDLKKEAEPHLRKLSAELNMTVFMATMMSNEVVYIDQIQVFDGFRKYASIGERRPMYCTALGKSLLMGYSDKALKEYAESVEYIPLTKNTITDSEDLIRDIKLSLSRGWSCDEEELQDEIKCRAVPVFDYRGHIIAAISTSGFSKLVEGEREVQIVEALRKTAAAISRNLGCGSSNCFDGV